MNRLEGKVVIVTGSTSGIGTGIAQVCAREGASVVVTGRRKEKGQGIVDEIVANGGKASFCYLDITQEDTIINLFEYTAKTYGKIDVLVNNAANVSLKDGKVTDLTAEMWDAIFNSDLRSVFLATKHVIPYMIENKKGSIVNIGSMASCGGDLGATAYASAKAGVELLTMSTAMQYGKLDIRCNCIRPGLIVTPDNEAKVPPFVKDVFLNNIEVNRVGNPEDIANLVLFLASEESEFITSQIMTVDGGMNSHVTTVGEFARANSKTW